MGASNRLTTDYDDVESSNFRAPRSNSIGQVWLYDPDKNIAFLKWPDQHLSVHSSGKTAWWYPYVTSKNTRAVLLSKYPDDSEGNWLINPKDMQ